MGTPEGLCSRRESSYKSNRKFKDLPMDFRIPQNRLLLMVGSYPSKQIAHQGKALSLQPP